MQTRYYYESCSMPPGEGFGELDKGWFELTGNHKVTPKQVLELLVSTYNHPLGLATINLRNNENGPLIAKYTSSAAATARFAKGVSAERRDDGRYVNHLRIPAITEEYEIFSEP